MSEPQKDDHTNGPRFPWARLLLVSGIILVALSCLGLLAGIVYFWGDNAGIFSGWHKLGSPPEEAVELVTGDINVVYARTATGHIYECKHSEIKKPNNCWLEAEGSPVIDPETEFDNPLFQEALDPPGGKIVDELVTTIWYADAAFETRYVLNEDGSVWKWEHDRSSWDIFLCFLGPLAGFAVGLVFAAGLWAFVGLRRLILQTNVNRI